MLFRRGATACSIPIPSTDQVRCLRRVRVRDRGAGAPTQPQPGQADPAHDPGDAINHAAATVAFTTDSHPANAAGWPIRWGKQTLTKVITVAADGEVTDGMVAGYLAKYATKSTEITGHTSPRLDRGDLDTINVYANPTGSHCERLFHAALTLGRPKAWRRLRRWAHMLGFGGHFLTKSRRYSVTFGILRRNRIVYRRTITSSGPESVDGQVPEQETTLVVNFLQFVGAGWHTTADALLANTSAALAREHEDDVLDYLTGLAG